jgi:hypothetical protein
MDFRHLPSGKTALRVVATWALATLCTVGPGVRAALADATSGPTPTPMPFHLVKLPNGDYTVPLRELERAGATGMVTLHPSGPKTLVTVMVYGNPARHYLLHLHTGGDCMGAAAATTTADLAPTFGGQRSQTLVALPITNLTSKGYAVDVHDATEKSQFAEACAKLR